MNKQRSSSILKSMINSSGSEKDLSGISIRNKSVKKKKKLKTKRSDANSSHRRSDSENDRSTALAGLSSSISMSTFPEREQDNTETETPIQTKSKANEPDLDRIPVSMSSSKSKKKSEKVVVHVRLRPFNKHESDKKHKSAILKFDTGMNLVSVRKDKAEGTKAKFYFDSLLHENITQEEVYESAGKQSVSYFTFV